VTSQAERDAYVQQLAPEFARQLQVKVDGALVPLKLMRWTSSLPTEQGGFSLRLDADFVATLSAGLANGTHELTFANRNYDGRFGWHEITVQAAPSLHVFNTNGFDTSLTNGLTEALQSLPASGPLDERELHLSFTRGAVPPGAVLLGSRTGAAQPVANSVPAGGGENAWLQRQTRALIDLISAPHVALHVTLFALLAAFVLGALHAFSPGHGKTIVGAYLIGSHGTPKHAAFLGLTVTITHTLGVFALGFATLFASRFIVPERLFPILSLFSGLIVLGMGMILLAQRWRAARTAFVRQPHVDRSHANHAWHDHRHAHDDDHSHGHGHRHSHDGAVMHSHGGSMHSHALPTHVTWKSLLALGVSGGLIPCPSAMVLLLAAVALNKAAYGLLLVVAFSIGLAVTLTLVGLAFLYARSRFPKVNSSSRWPILLPVASAAAIAVVGVVLCFGALQTAQW